MNVKLKNECKNSLKILASSCMQPLSKKNNTFNKVKKLVL